MDKRDYKNMTNNEISLELKKLENKYESIKTKVIKMIEEMKTLDALYVDGKKELTNRSKGIF